MQKDFWFKTDTLLPVPKIKVIVYIMNAIDDPYIIAEYDGKWGGNRGAWFDSKNKLIPTNQIIGWVFCNMFVQQAEREMNMAQRLQELRALMARDPLLMEKIAIQRTSRDRVEQRRGRR